MPGQLALLACGSKRRRWLPVSNDRKQTKEKSVAKYMSIETALARLVEDDSAPVGARVRALRQLAHPELSMLRRLLVDTAKRIKPVPSRLLAVATLAYAREIQFRKGRKAANVGQRQKKDNGANALGI